MEIKINEEALAEAIKSSVGEALKDAAGAWKIRQKIQEAAANAINASGLVEQVSAAMAREVDEQAATIVQQVVAQVAPVLGETLKASTVRTMAKLIVRVNASGYMTDVEEGVATKAEVERIEQRLSPSGEVAS